MSQTHLLTNPTVIRTDIPEADRLLTEAGAHMLAAEGYFRSGIQRESEGKSFAADLFHAVIQLQAATLCQQQAMIYLLTDDVPSPAPDEVSTCN